MVSRTERFAGGLILLIVGVLAAWLGLGFLGLQPNPGQNPLMISAIGAIVLLVGIGLTIYGVLVWLGGS